MEERGDVYFFIRIHHKPSLSLLRNGLILRSTPDLPAVQDFGRRVRSGAVTGVQIACIDRLEIVLTDCSPSPPYQVRGRLCPLPQDWG